MIVLKVRGGLGNQMFQYAYAKVQAERLKTALYYDSSLLKNSKNAHAPARGFALGAFNLSIDKISPIRNYLLQGVPFHYFGSRILNKLQRILFGNHLVLESSREFNNQYLAIEDKSCIVGSFQSPLYFGEHRDFILKEFEFNHEVVCDASEAAVDIKQGNSVCLHVRKGDYVNDPFFNPILGHIGLDYYESAIVRLKTLVDKPVFYIFSDDIEWAEINIGQRLLKNDRYTICTEVDSKWKDHVYMYLMSLCKHFIISNSTYAWWGAWLAKSENKNVICPNDLVHKDFQNDLSNNPRDILPLNWIRI